MQTFRSYERRAVGFDVHYRQTSKDRRKHRPHRLEKYSNTERFEIGAQRWAKEAGGGGAAVLSIFWTNINMNSSTSVRDNFWFSMPASDEVSGSLT